MFIERNSDYQSVQKTYFRVNDSLGLHENCLKNLKLTIDILKLLMSYKKYLKCFKISFKTYGRHF